MTRTIEPPCKSKALPSKRAIEQGFYIDFEGFRGKEEYYSSRSQPPLLIGIYTPVDKHFRQVVFTKAYRFAAENSSTKYPVTYEKDRIGFLKQLVSESRRNRPLFAFTQHEYRTINDLLGTKSIEKRYRDVHKITKQYLKKQHPDIKRPFTLLKVAKRLGLRTTDKVEDHSITRRLNKVSEYSCSGKKWKTAPKEIKVMWSEVLAHNKWDCEVMYKALMKIAKSKASVQIV